MNRKDSSSETSVWRKKPLTEGNVAFKEYRGLLKLQPVFWSWLELAAFILGALGGGWVAYDRYPHLGSPIPISASLVGLTVGALIAGLAIMARSNDENFLKNLRDANAQPASQFFSPFITTATVGILAILAILVYTILPVDFPAGWRAVFGAAAGALTLLTLAGLTGALGTLIQYVDLYEFFATQDKEDDEGNSGT